MARDQQEPKPIILRPTVEGAEEHSLLALVPENVLLLQGVTQPRLESAYSAWVLPGKMTLGNDYEGVSYETYICTGPEKSPQDGWLAFGFGKPKTEQQKKTPFARHTRFDLHDWDTVLFGLGMIPDPHFLRSTVAAVNGQKTVISGPSSRVRPLFIEGGSYGTKFVIKEYLLPTAFKIPRHRSPVGTSVSYDTGDREGHFSRALHETITLDRQRSVTATVAGDSGGAGSGVIAGKEFPATEMTTWTRHVIYDDQKRVNGVWYRVKITAIPPPIPDTISAAA